MQCVCAGSLYQNRVLCPSMHFLCTWFSEFERPHFIGLCSCVCCCHLHNDKRLRFTSAVNLQWIVSKDEASSFIWFPVSWRYVICWRASLLSQNEWTNSFDYIRPYYMVASLRYKVVLENDLLFESWSEWMAIRLCDVISFGWFEV